MNIGEKITALRKAKKLSQTDLAKEANVSREIIGRYERNEVSPSVDVELAKQIDTYHSIIGKYERDEVKPTVDVIKKFAEILDTTVSYLMGETENQNVFKDPAMFKRMAEIESLP